ncbi:hypothetical protein L2E82_28194 [Cichorium intybus]|uniref:Uncharacterized protein n=1 Tax=Cichorium intybus TaxID=13427 RepID=A0ACB9CV33_CICIN|nr:hypothetical protein L2E82_28194 [Cichorium intybus]
MKSWKRRPSTPVELEEPTRLHSLISSFSFSPLPDRWLHAPAHYGVFFAILVHGFQLLDIWLHHSAGNTTDSKISKLLDMSTAEKSQDSFMNFLLFYYLIFKAGELAENVSKIIDAQLADGVDMSEVEVNILRDEFSAVITKALVTLVNGLETKFDIEMAAMTCVPWATLESVGDQSEYVNNIKIILNGSIPVLGTLLSPVYFQFFLDKLASSLGPRFYLNIFKCKHRDWNSTSYKDNTFRYSIPWKTGAASYSKFVSREMSKAEALLKVILFPVDSVEDTYSALLPEGTPSEFQRILDLKIKYAHTLTPIAHTHSHTI